jgi:hypothetical protein
MQIRVPGELLILHLVARDDHLPGRVVGELQPADMTRLTAALSAFAVSRHADMLGEESHSLSGALNVRVIDLRLFYRWRERPGHGHGLVGGRAEVVRADRRAERALSGALVRGLPHLRVDLPLDRRSISLPAGDECADLV